MKKQSDNKVYRDEGNGQNQLPCLQSPTLVYKLGIILGFSGPGSYKNGFSARGLGVWVFGREKRVQNKISIIETQAESMQHAHDRIGVLHSRGGVTDIAEHIAMA